MSLKKLTKKGFTLIELMIVVAIIGILAAVAIPRFADLVTKSKEAAVKGNLGAVRSAVSIYYGDQEGAYPGNLFVGLTTGNRYMPALNNAASLGVFDIPAHANTPANTGHSHGSVAGIDEVRQAGGVNDAVALYYTTIDGALLVNCTHNDTKGTIWTSY